MVLFQSHATCRIGLRPTDCLARWDVINVHTFTATRLYQFASIALCLFVCLPCYNDLFKYCRIPYTDDEPEIDDDDQLDGRHYGRCASEHQHKNKIITQLSRFIILNFYHSHRCNGNRLLRVNGITSQQSCYQSGIYGVRTGDLTGPARPCPPPTAPPL